jgi:predicted aspartyl protease
MVLYQKVSLRISVLLCALLAGGAAAAPTPELSPADLLFASPTTRDHIGRVVVPVTINGRGPFRFIVDTGANHSTISPQLVRALKLETEQGPMVTLDGITGAGQVSYVAIDSLRAGDFTIEDTVLPVVAESVMAGADGILGAAGISTKSLLIDFQHNQVAIAPFMGSAARRQGIKIHAARVAGGLIVLNAMVGRVPVRAVLDTGAERTLGNLALRDAVRSQGPQKKGFMAELTSVYGATQEIEAGEIVRVPTISIDSLRIMDAAIVYGNFHIFEVWELQHEPAMILGMDVLGTLAALNIDFKNLTVYAGNVLPAGGSMVHSGPQALSNIDRH